MITVEEALGLRGRTILVHYSFDTEDGMISGIQLGRVVGVVVPSVDSSVELRLLMVDDSDPNLSCTEGYQFEVCCSDIDSYQVIKLARGA